MAAGHQLQVVVPGGYWKNVQLLDEPGYDRFAGETPFCLLSEGVAPGFDYLDFEFDEDDAIRALVANK